MTGWVETPFPGYSVNAAGEVLGYFGRVLKPTPAGGRKRTYLQVRCGRGNPQYVHRLVSEAFLGPCPDGMEVAHKDGNGFNNRVENLMYKTKAENEQDKREHGTYNDRGRAVGERNVHAKLTEAQVRDIRSRINPVRKELAKEFGVSGSVISGIILRRTWKHLQ